MKLLLAITVAAFVAMFIMQMRRENLFPTFHILGNAFTSWFQVEVWGRSVTLEEDWKKFQTFRDRWTKDLHYGWATSWDHYRAPVSLKKIEIKKAESYQDKLQPAKKVISVCICVWL